MALAAWTVATSRDDPVAAYALLGNVTKRALPYEAFARRWRESRTEVAAQGSALAVVASPGLTEMATVRLSDGRTVRVVLDPDGWRMTAALLPAGHAATPADALRLLAEAVAGDDANTVLTLLAARRRAGLTELIESFRAGLEARSSSEIEIAGERAFLRWNDGALHWKVTLVREEGEWRVDELHGP